MSSTFDDSVLDFDINFLHPSNVNECRFDKQRKSIQIAKKKTIAIDSLIRKYMHNKDRWEQSEVVLLTAKEECKQVCIDYKEALEKCTQLEKELEILKNNNAELDAKCTLSQNQYEGMKSHATQLQILVKNHESVIEALTVEKVLEKNNCVKSEKNLSSVEKENEVLLRHLQLLKDIALGKKKLRKRHKILLQKYDNLKNNDYDSSSESIYDEPDFCNTSANSPLFTSLEDSVGDKTEHNVFQPNKIEMCVKKDSTRLNEDNDSNYSNEVVSEDTGRGSSLAFSDGEKCFNSPDYFNTDSPVATDAGKINEQAILMDSGKSPNGYHELVHVATSPRIFDDEALLSDNCAPFDSTIANNLEYFITDIPLSDEIVTIKEKRKLIDIGTSPVKEIEKVSIATSPLLFEESVSLDESNSVNSTQLTNIQKNCVKDNCLNYTNRKISRTRTRTPSIVNEDIVTGINGKHTTIDSLASHCELEISGKSIEERKCLERNNSNRLCDENSNDGEIEMILNAMKLTQRLITPIPKTPVKIQNLENRKVQESAKVPNLTSGHEVCREAVILRQQNKVLETNIANLRKDVMDIKCLIKNHLFSREGSKEQISNESERSINTEMFDDSSQETVYVYAIDDSNSIENESEINFDLPNILRNGDISPVIVANENECTDNINISLQNDVFISSDLSEQSNPTTQANSISSSKLLKVTHTDESPVLSKSIEKEFIAKHENNIASVAKNDSREAITFEEYLESEDDDIIINHDMSNTGKDLSIDTNKDTITKHKKLSKLDKFKKKLLPKSKISKPAPIRKLRSKSKLKPVTKERTRVDAIDILNNRSAYENAAKVMAEMKSMEKDSVKKKFTNRKPSVENDKLNKNSICLESEAQLSNINPVVCLADLNVAAMQTKCRKQRKSIDQNVQNDQRGDASSITTRSRSRQLSSNESITPTHRDKKEKSEKSEEKRRRLKRNATDSPSIACKRVLRSSSIAKSYVDLDYSKESGKTIPDRRHNIENVNLFDGDNKKQNQNYTAKTISSADKNIFDCKLSNDGNGKLDISHDSKTVSATSNETGDRKLSNIKRNAQHRSDEGTDDDDDDGDSDDEPLVQSSHPKQSILCKMIDKHGRTEKSCNKKVPDSITNSICKKLEDCITSINELPASKANSSMSKLVDEVRSWNIKHFMSGFIQYLKDPNRKKELFNKVNTPPAPPMTKSEQVLLYIVRQLETDTPKIVDSILFHIEFSLFQLNRSPEFDIIESLSHFYALLCRYFGLKSRLRLFLMDAMYCLQFKVVPLIKQCLDVWMHILPLAHMGIAKSPLVTCLVYLLHFYKCEDRFNRVQEIRFILSRKYFYEITDWNETKILEMFKNAIREIRDIPIEKKLLRMSLIILGKRQGPRWCQKNIIHNMLIPMIERDDVSMSIKQFCAQMLGPLLKPFPADMKVHFEIAVNHLHDLLDKNPPDTMKEAIFTSLIYINNHNPNRVIQLLLTWMPKQISPEFEEFLRDYVRIKPVKAWKKLLSRITM